jgi:hypothetical protein
LVTAAAEALIAAELDTPVDPRVAAMAAAIAALYPQAARAVLFYGSCLRETRLDGLMLDFYVLVSGYRAAYGRGWFAAANRLLPPNVFPFEHGGLAAKYAVMCEGHFARECSRAARDPSTFARFSQPARIAWAADRAARIQARAAVSRAPETLLRLVRPTLDEGAAADPLAGFRAGYRLTFAAELRAERGSRPDAIVEAAPARYAALAAALGWPFFADPVGVEARAGARAGWRRFQRRGRRRQVLRLLKASTTFVGGLDYLAWKINRHAGTAIAIRPWQRRWPVLGALTLLPRLLRRGAVR